VPERLIGVNVRAEARARAGLSDRVRTNGPALALEAEFPEIELVDPIHEFPQGNPVIQPMTINCRIERSLIPASIQLGLLFRSGIRI
jgi:hypothetical protein